MDAHEILKKGAELQAARHAALEPLAEILAERMPLEGEIRAAWLRLEKTHAETGPETEPCLLHMDGLGPVEAHLHETTTLAVSSERTRGPVSAQHSIGPAGSR
ncbi:hypothetical protein OHU17_37740 (plasmid) [Streptomyces goshikiensis]|uniref:Uncharacterized protein n=1 Tax=Streptomyces goshikiensis TaxID=1942 RepID=A0ABZ1RYN3_9ACTN|nr:hypothetical protein [Streptomyces goshikiensis]